MRNGRNSLMLLPLIGVAALTGAPEANGAGFEFGGYYVGVAAAYTDASRQGDESGLGMSYYAGADFFTIPAVARRGVEVGHIRSRKIEFMKQTRRISKTGASVMATLTTIPIIDLHARLGYEGGDSSGAVSALGFTIKPMPILGIRGEYASHKGFDAYTLGIRFRFR